MDIKLIKKLYNGASGKTFRINDTVAKTGLDAGILCEIIVLKYLPRHPNIIELVSYNINKKLTICTRYAGKDLHYWRKKDADMPTLVAQILPQLVEAITHLHTNHIEHCDIKPGNIVYDRATGRATLIDFGAIHFCGNEYEHVGLDYIPYIGCDAVVGAFARMLWGVGASLYYLLTGHSPKCRNRFDDSDLDHSDESESDYIDDDGNCTCVACIDWGQYTEPIYEQVRRCIYGEYAEMPTHTQVCVKLPPKRMCDAYTAIGKLSCRDVFYRAYYFYRILQNSTPSPNAGRVCYYLADALWSGVGTTISPDAILYFEEFMPIIEVLYKHMFDMLPDTLHIEEYGDIPTANTIIAEWD